MYDIVGRTGTVGCVGEVLNWDDESAAYIRNRGDRYPGGGGAEPNWRRSR